MNRYVIERDIPGVHTLEEAGLREAACTSNAALAKLAPKAQWEHSYVTKDKTFCIYLADSEDSVREHARISGFPANKITLVTGIIDPTTANS